MGCEVFEFMGHRAIMCGPGINPKPKRCAFCKHRSTKLCDWAGTRKGVKATCDKPCCYRHSRHVGPDRDYCQDHWRQENIA